MPFKRKPIRFEYSGVDLNAPLDRMPPDRCPACENWRQEVDGAMSIRPGQGNGSPLIAAQTPLHSVRRIDDSSSGSTVSTEIIGAGTHLGTVSTDLSAATDRDSGYSGDPLSMVLHRPSQSVKKWMYVADRSRMRKVDQAGNVKQIGIAAPAGPPSAALTQPFYKAIDEFDENPIVNWLIGGTAAVLATNLRVDPATRSITEILYDSGSAGWCLVQPSSMTNIGRGARLTINNGGGSAEIVTVQDVYRGSSQTAIYNALPEVSYPGYAWLQLSTAVEEVDVGALVLLNAAIGTPEYVRVLAVERSVDGFAAFRAFCNADPIGGIGNSAQVVPAFRAYCANTHANGESLLARAMSFSVAVGTGFVTRTLAVDLSTIATTIPTRPEDREHISLFIDKPELVSEIKIYKDIDSTTNDFTQNYLIKVLRQNDFIPVTKDTQSSIDNQRIRDQRTIIDRGRRQLFQVDNPVDVPVSVNIPIDPVTLDPVVGSPTDRTTQTDSGANQYTEVIFPISDLLTPDIGRVGSDYSRGLANVAALKIAVITTGTVVIRLDSWWIGGGFGPDTSGERPFIYRYRGRDSSTGVVGNYSPPMRGGVSPYRQQVDVSLPLHPSADVDKLDVERYGGVLQGWYYTGTADNSGAPVLHDTMSALDLSDRSVESSQQNQNYQLWPCLGLPVAAQTIAADVAGPLVKLSSGSIDVTTAPGSLVKIAGKDAHIYRVWSTTQFETIESNIGLQLAMTYPVEIPEPTIRRDLPILAGPFYNFYLGAGDPANPWRLYYSNGNDCDSTRDDHWIDIETETILNILVTDDDRAFVLTAGGVWAVEPSFSLAETGGDLFRKRKISSTPLFARWACCVVPGGISYLGQDAIYFNGGGDSTPLTEDLRPIFPHEESLGTLTNGFYPPNMIAAQEANLRLSCAGSELYFDYVDTNSTRRTIVRRIKPGDKNFGWRVYSYAVPAILHYQEEGKNVRGALLGGTDGKLYRLGRIQADAAGASITASIQTHSEDDDDPIIRKDIGHCWLDYDTDGATINVTPGFDNHSVTLTPTALSDAAGRKRKTLDFNSGQGQFARNIDLLVTATVTTKRPILYIWQPTFSDRPEQSFLRADDFQIKGGEGVKLARRIWIFADTFSQARTAKLQYTIDDGSISELTISGINHATLTERSYDLPAGTYLIASRLLPTDSNSWELADYRIEGEPAPPLSDAPTQWIVLDGVRFVQGIVPDIDTRGANVNLQVQVDQAITQTTIQAGLNSGPVNSAARARLPFSFDQPFLTHLIRFVPSALCRIWDIDVKSRPDSELAYMWRTQQTACGIDGWKVFGGGYLSLRSTDDVRFFIIADGVSKEAVFFSGSTNTSGNRRRFRFRCPPIKAKSVEFQVQASTINGRVAPYEHDFALELRPWAWEGSWRSINPLGGTHFDRGGDI
jgi:hypothetical protein